MSIKIMSRVWEYSNQKGSDLLLLLAIADNADDSGYCWPGITYLAKKVRMTERSIINIVRRLEQSGELIVQHNRRNGNRYGVLTGMDNPEIVLLCSRLDIKCEEISHLESNMKNFHIRSETRFTSDVKPVSHEPSITSNEPSYTPSDEQAQHSGQSELDDYFGEDSEPSISRKKEYEPVDWANQEQREQAINQSTRKFAARQSSEPWAALYDWIRPRDGIAERDLRRVAHILIESGLSEPASDQVKRAWRPNIAAIYQESGGNWGLIERAAREIVAQDQKFCPPHKWAQVVARLKASSSPSKSGARGGGRVQKFQYV
jgi:hypothetical protein